MPEHINDAMFDTIKLSRELQPLNEAVDWTIADSQIKITEEVGEFAEAVMIERGKITNKPRIMDAPFYEAADSIQCILDVLARVYPNMSPAQLCTLVHHAINKKNEKWAAKVRSKFDELLGK